MPAESTDRLCTALPASVANGCAFDRAEATRHAGVLAAHLGPASFLSLAGIKDIVLASTARPMPLPHLQHGPLAAPAAEVTASQPGAIHMTCTVDRGALDRSLRAAGAQPDASATVLHAGLDDADRSFVLTSDI